MFKIQVSNPKVINKENLPPKEEIPEEAKAMFPLSLKDGLSGAIQTIFPINTEEVFIFWHHIRIPLSYKYDMCSITLDILYMLDEIFSSKKGSFTEGFSSDTFRVDWNIKWDTKKNKIQIEANWENVLGGLEDILSTEKHLEMELDLFLYEWKGLLRKVIESLETSEIEIEDKEELALLYRIEAAIPKFGVLYRDE